MFCCPIALTDHVAGEHLAIEIGTHKLSLLKKYHIKLMEHLPIPPVQQIGNLLPLLGIIQEIQDALIELFGVHHCVRPTEYR